MADVEKRKIKFRRGQEAHLPTLDEGEPALTLDTNKFFIGGTNGNIQLADQKDLETLSSSVDGVKKGVSTAQTDISGLKTDVTTAKEAVSKLQTDVSTVKTDLDTAEGNIGSLQTDMTAAKADVSTLKTDMTTAKADVSALKTDMTTAKSDISTLKSDVGTATADVSALKTDMTTAKADISTLKSDVDTAKSDVSTLKSGMTTAKSNISSLQTDVGGLKKLISSSNGAVDVGDAARDATIKGKTKVSIAAPILNVSSRETYHQGNFCNHALFSSSEAVAPATLPKDTYTDLKAVLDTVDSAFPAGSASAAAYTVPREGVYSFNVTVKVTTAVTATAGYIRFGLKQSRGETVTDLDIQDVHYSNAFGTPLLSATFIYKCAAGDVITPEIKPLTEDITVGAGSKCSIYFLGDSIQA